MLVSEWKFSSVLTDAHLMGLTADSVSSGSLVCLFNRVRSQNSTTRYLASNTLGTDLTLRAPQWEAWYIWAVDDPDFDPATVPGESCNAASSQFGPTYDRRPTTSATRRFVSVPSTPPTSRLSAAANLLKLPVVRDRRTPAVSARLASGSRARIKRSTLISESERLPPPVAAVQPTGRALCFGDVVVLQSAVSGLVTVPLVLRAVEGRSEAVIDEEVEDLASAEQGEAISQLHKVCFALFDSKSRAQYLGSDHTSVAVITPRSERNLSASTGTRRPVKKRKRNTEEETETRLGSGPKVLHEVGESGMWTIVGVQQVEYSFWIPPKEALPPKEQEDAGAVPRQLPLSPHPIPVVFSIRRASHTSFVLLGIKFSDRLRCALGTKFAFQTIFRCTEVMQVEMAEEGAKFVHDGPDEVGSSGIEPVLLIRDDGVVYRAGEIFQSFDISAQPLFL
ncbi:hypothetical protein DFJ73DRAFT_827214 [Zopfochytrium polystomum]|nr:hypothetical protein DFJ73DRAFT_827214 [Zopfochytrium polystomum]